MSPQQLPRHSVSTEAQPDILVCGAPPPISFELRPGGAMTRGSRTWGCSEGGLGEGCGADQLQGLLAQVLTQQLLLGPALGHAHCTAESGVGIPHGRDQGVVCRSCHELGVGRRPGLPRPVLLACGGGGFGLLGDGCIPAWHSRLIQRLPRPPVWSSVQSVKAQAAGRELQECWRSGLRGEAAFSRQACTTQCLCHGATEQMQVIAISSSAGCCTTVGEGVKHVYPQGSPVSCSNAWQSLPP